MNDVCFSDIFTCATLCLTVSERPVPVSETPDRLTNVQFGDGRCNQLKGLNYCKTACDIGPWTNKSTGPQTFKLSSWTLNLSRPTKGYFHGPGGLGQVREERIVSWLTTCAWHGGRVNQPAPGHCAYCSWIMARMAAEAL